MSHDGFLAAADRGVFVLPRCSTCAGYAEPGQPCCSSCGGKLDWVPASGAGTVFSYAVVHQVFHPSLAGEVPYVVAIVELAEGPRLVTRLIGFDAVGPSVGAPVEVGFQLFGDRRLPVFRPLTPPVRPLRPSDDRGALVRYCREKIDECCVDDC